MADTTLVEGSNELNVALEPILLVTRWVSPTGHNDPTSEWSSSYFPAVIERIK